MSRQPSQTILSTSLHDSSVSPLSCLGPRLGGSPYPVRSEDRNVQCPTHPWTVLRSRSGIPSTSVSRRGRGPRLHGVGGRPTPDPAPETARLPSILETDLDTSVRPSKGSRGVYCLERPPVQPDLPGRRSGDSLHWSEWKGLGDPTRTLGQRGWETSGATDTSVGYRMTRTLI